MTVFCSVVIFNFFFFLHQPSLGNSDQGCNAEVSQPHEPQCVWGRCFGQRHWQTGTPPQQKTSQHRVGSSIHSEICEFGKSKVYQQYFSTVYCSINVQKKLAAAALKLSCFGHTWYTLRYTKCTHMTLNRETHDVKHVFALVFWIPVFCIVQLN